MSQRHIYKCDRCDKEQEARDQFWQIGISVRSVDMAHTAPTLRHATEWCRECVDEVRLLDGAVTKFLEDDARRKGQPRPADPPTIEEMLRAIIQEEINEDANQRGR